MNTRLSVWIGQGIVAAMLGLSATLTVLPHPAYAQPDAARFELTRAQAADIKLQKDETYTWAQTGLANEQPEHRNDYANQAAITVETMLITSYAEHVNKADTDEAMNNILGVYSASRGSVVTNVTTEQERRIDVVMDEQRAALKPRLLFDQMVAVGITTRRHLDQMASLDQAEGISFGGEKETLDVYRERSHMIDDVFYHLDWKTVPGSPFYGNEMPPVTSTLASPAPAPQPVPSAVAPQPVQSAAPDPSAAAAPDQSASAPPREPTFDELVAANPDGIVTEHNGRIVEAQPDSTGEMQIIDHGEPPADDNKNVGNSRTRTGSEDDGKKDKDRENRPSGGDSKPSGGGTPHK